MNATIAGNKTYLRNEFSFQNIQTSSSIVRRTSGVASTHSRSVHRDESERQTATPLQIVLQGGKVVTGNAGSGEQTVVQKLGLVMYRTRPVENQRNHILRFTILDRFSSSAGGGWQKGLAVQRFSVSADSPQKIFAQASVWGRRDECRTSIGYPRGGSRHWASVRVGGIK
jgi:hypothetical protein